VTIDIASFPDPWPEVFELLGYAKEPERLHLRKKLPLFGVLKRKVSAHALCARIETLSPLAQMAGLEEIDLCGARRVDDLSPLAGCSKLKSVVMWQTGIRDLEALAGKTKLQRLYVWCTNITSLEPLATTPALEVLNIEFTPVESLAPLGGLKKLTELNISGTPIRLLDALEKVPIASLLAYRTALDPESLKRFRAAHPGCVISEGDDYPNKSTRCGC